MSSQLKKVTIWIIKIKIKKNLIQVRLKKDMKKKKKYQMNM